MEKIYIIKVSCKNLLIFNSHLWLHVEELQKKSTFSSVFTATCNKCIVQVLLQKLILHREGIIICEIVVKEK